MVSQSSRVQGPWLTIVQTLMDEAIEQFEQAVRLDPSNANARANLERARTLCDARRPFGRSGEAP